MGTLREVWLANVFNALMKRERGGDDNSIGRVTLRNASWLEEYRHDLGLHLTDDRI